MKIVVRAGGVGSRLWPVSRETKPKQLHALTSEKTMLQEAVERALEVVEPEDILVSGNKKCEQGLRDDLGAILESNLIIEPARRDTAAAVGLETILAGKDDPTTVIASLGSDHSIKNNEEFARLLKVGEEFLKENPDTLLCLGIKPTGPDTGYGYIEMGDKLTDEIFSVNSFKEKPELEVAKEFVGAGNYLWNGNMFMWRADTVLKLFEKHQPKMYAQLMEIQADPSKLETVYPEIEKVAVDYAILEHADKIAALPADIGWNDIGDWARLKEELQENKEDNIVRSKNHISRDDKDTLVFSETDRLIATIGLEDVVIVDTGDALFVAKKSQAQEVKKIVDELKDQDKNQYL